MQHTFPGDAEWQPRAARFAAAIVDLLELVEPLKVTPPAPLRVAYHPHCSLQNILKLNGKGEALLAASGLTVVPFLESHICCGAAARYSVLQPELSETLRLRKAGPYQCRQSRSHRFGQYRLHPAAQGRRPGAAHRRIAGLGRGRPPSPMPCSPPHWFCHILRA